MGITYVGYTSNWQTNGGNTVLPVGSIAGIQDGDFMVCFAGGPDGAGAALITSDGGGTWATVTTAGGTDPVCRGRVSTKFVAGDTQITVQGTTNLGHALSAICKVFRGVDPTTPLDVAIAQAVSAAAGSANPDPPSLTSVTHNACSVAGATSAVQDATPGALAAPYVDTQVVTPAVGETYQSTTAVAHGWIGTAGALNPGAFPTWSSGKWVASHVILRPTPDLPTVTGTLGVTEAADVAAMAGTVTGNVGRLIAVEAPDVAAFAVVASGYRQSVQVRVNDVAVGVRQENATALAPVDQEFDITAARTWTPADFRDGTLSVYLGSHATDAPFEGHWDATSLRVTYVLPPNRTGILDAVEAADVAAFVGVGPPVEGTLAATEAADLVAFVGELVTHGALVGIEAADVAAWAGFVASQGTLAATEAPDVAALTGTVQAKGTLAATEAPDVAVIVAKIVGTGTLAATEAADAAAFTGGVVVGGTLAATDQPDRASFNGAGIGVNGILDAEEAADVAVFAAKVATVGTLAASEASDLAAFAGEAVAILGTLAATDAPDVAAFAGGTTGTGIVAAVEAPDVAVIVGKAITFGTLAATEAADTAVVVGGVAWVATLAASEAPDVAAITGTVRLAGTLAAVEAPDVAAITGAIIVSGALDATEAPDEAAFFQTSIAGFFAALEASDNAIILATHGDYAVDIVGDEDPHTIHGGCEGVSTITGNARTPTIKGSV